jgi:hypothetical protein
MTYKIVDDLTRDAHFIGGGVYAKEAETMRKAAAHLEALAEAGQAILDRMSSTFKARNGRDVGIEADDGEKCWIVHSDDIEALRTALSNLREGQGGEQ